MKTAVTYKVKDFSIAFQLLTLNTQGERGMLTI
jgi:hypothetical protein